MIFYKSKAEDGRMVITGTQAEARAVNRDFSQIDIPTDKAGLMAFAQRWADEEFALNKMLDMQSAELVRLHEEAPASMLSGCMEFTEPAVQGGETSAIAQHHAVLESRLQSAPAGDNLTVAIPTISIEIQKDREFTAEIRRQISVEEEIQNCGLPRLATLAANVAWRFEELSKKPETSKWAERAAGTWHPGDEA